MWHARPINARYDATICSKLKVNKNSETKKNKNNIKYVYCKGKLQQYGKLISYRYKKTAKNKWHELWKSTKNRKQNNANQKNRIDLFFSVFLIANKIQIMHKWIIVAFLMAGN